MWFDIISWWIIGIITQDFSCVGERCYKIWYENNKVKNCKIYSEHALSLEKTNMKQTVKKSIETKGHKVKNYKHRINSFK